MAHSISEQERKRIEAVRALCILDTAPEERFDRFTRVVKRLFNAKHAFISIVDTDRQWFKSMNGLNVSETPREISFCTHAIREDRVMVVNDATLDPRFSENPFVTGEPHLRFYAGCPLREANGYRVGTLCITDTQPREFSEEDRGLLSDVASMAEQELASMQLATLDELTKLSNRRGFLHLAQHSSEFCQRLGLPAALMVFDLDDLKPINDTLGHEAGDTLLKEFSSLLIRNMRETDVCARIGGDEFVVFLPGADAARAEWVMNRFRKRVAEFNDSSQLPFEIHFSAGCVTRTPHQTLKVDQMLKDADDLMYEQKRRRKRDRQTG